MFLITYLTTSSPNVFAAGHSDCTTSLPSPGVRPLRTLFHSVSSFSFYSAWTVPKCFLLGFLSLKLDPPLLDSLPGCLGQHLASDPRADSISVSSLADPVVPDVVNPWPHSYSMCHNPSLSVLLFAWKPGYRGRRKEGELVHGSCTPCTKGSGAVGSVMVAIKCAPRKNRGEGCPHCDAGWAKYSQVWWDGH